MVGIAWPIDAVPDETGSPEYAARQGRQASLAPLIAGATAARPLGARSGVRPGTPASTVAVTSTTWTVHQLAGVADVQSASEAGPYGFAFDADQTGTVNPAHMTYTRWDALYVVIDDPAEDESGTPSCRIEYRAGTAALSPALPSTPPARSVRLCRIVVPQSGGGSPSVVWDPPYLAPPGGPYRVRSDTERDALYTAFGATDENPLTVVHIGTSNPKKGVTEQTFDGVTWTGAWASYTPVLTGSTTNPTMGSGGIQQGRYVVNGKTCIGWFTWQFGSGGAAGSGTYEVSLPVAMAATDTAANLGTAWMFVGGQWYPADMIRGTSSTRVQFRVTGATPAVGASNPAGWSAPSTALRAQFVYEVA